MKKLAFLLFGLLLSSTTVAMEYTDIVKIYSVDSDSYMWPIETILSVRPNGELEDLTMADEHIVDFDHLDTENKKKKVGVRFWGIPVSSVTVKNFDKSSGGKVKIKVPGLFTEQRGAMHLELDLQYDETIGEWTVIRDGQRVSSIYVNLNKNFNDISLWNLPKVKSIEYIIE